MKEKDYLPTIVVYSDLLEMACIKFQIDRKKARSAYGLFSVNQWEELLNVTITHNQIQAN